MNKSGVYTFTVLERIQYSPSAKYFSPCSRIKLNFVSNSFVFYLRDRAVHPGIMVNKPWVYTFTVLERTQYSLSAKYFCPCSNIKLNFVSIIFVFYLRKLTAVSVSTFCIKTV